MEVRISATLEVVDLERSNVDVAVRFVPSHAGSGPLLFEEEVQPMCAPQLLRDPQRPLKAPADLERHTLLTVEMQDAPLTADWEPWLRLMGLPAVHMAHTVRFTRYGEAVAFLTLAPHGAHNASARAFADWLLAEARREAGSPPRKV